MNAYTGLGLYRGMSDVEYHGDPVPGGSLSSTGARMLLPPNCPAMFAYQRENGRPDTNAFDLGHAAHHLVLGRGPNLVEVEGKWNTNAAKEDVAAVRANGGVPLHTEDLATVKAMAAAIRAHPVASRVFDPENGDAEVSIFWQDEQSGITRRSRLDWLPHDRGQRLVIPDYKTCDNADPAAFVRNAISYSYHQQHAWEIDAVRSQGIGDEEVRFVFVAQEKKPPYLLSIVQLDVVAYRIGHRLNREAIEVYARCTKDNRWPGYNGDELALMPLPVYYERQFEEDYIR